MNRRLTLLIFSVIALALMLCACGSKSLEGSSPEKENLLVTDTSDMSVEAPKTEETESLEHTERITRVKARVVDGDRDEYVYDENGRLLRIGDSEAFEYDELGRVTKRIYAFAIEEKSIESILETQFGTDIETSGSMLTDEQRDMLRNNYSAYDLYEYDAAGNIASETTFACLYMYLDMLDYQLFFYELSHHCFDYDGDSRIVSEEEYSDSSKTELISRFAIEYDDAGKMTCITEYSSDGEIVSEYANQETEGDRVEYLLDENDIYTCTYDENGKMIEKQSLIKAFDDEAFYELYRYDYEGDLLVKETNSRIWEYCNYLDELPSAEWITIYEYEEVELTAKK